MLAITKQREALDFNKLSLLLGGIFMTGANAAIVVQTPVSQDTAFTVSNTDLLQTSVSSTIDSLTINIGENNAAGANTSAVLSDGAFGLGTDPTPSPVNPGGRTGSVVIDYGTITYNLDTSVNTLGYDIIKLGTGSSSA